MIEQLIYDAVKSKLEYMDSVGHYQDVIGLLESELERYLGQFKIGDLNQISLTGNINDNSLLFYAIYKSVSARKELDTILDQIQSELIELRYCDSVITPKDIEDVISKYKGDDRKWTVKNLKRH